MLIDSSGKNLGVLSFEDAYSMAKKASLDLVQVSPSDANPIVCKLMDYGKHLFEKKKNSGTSRVKIKRNTIFSWW